MAQNSGYEDIATHYRQKIRDGELRPGDPMPSLRRICEKFGVARTTANRAFRKLRSEGLTIATTGVGTVVAEPVSSTTATRHEATGRPSTDGGCSSVPEAGTVSADELVASRLGVPPGTPVYVCRQTVSRGGVPVHFSSSYSLELPEERPRAAREQAQEEVTSRFATGQEQAALGLTAGDVVVTQVLRTVTSTDGRVVKVVVEVTGGSTILRWSTSRRSTAHGAPRGQVRPPTKT